MSTRFYDTDLIDAARAWVAPVRVLTTWARKPPFRRPDGRWTTQCWIRSTLGAPEFQSVTARITMLLVARAGRRRGRRS
jgi:hypothetical protein